MKFSILIPVYNVELYLEECIQSVLTQTYQDFEIILVDDGSNDQSGEICDWFSAKYPERIISYHLENRGALLARQYGVAHSTGDVLVFLDSDDCLRWDTLELLHLNFNQQRCDMILFNLSKKADYSTSDSLYYFNEENIISEKADVLRALVSGKMPNGICVKAVLRHCAENIPDLSKMAYIKNGEDLLYSIYLITNAHCIFYLAENLYYYRQHEGSVIHTFNQQITQSIRAVHEVMEQYVDIWGMPGLHPTQYARAVWGWTDILTIFMNNQLAMSFGEYRNKLREIMEDSFFRKAYANMDPSILSDRQIRLSNWLYKRDYFSIYAASALFRCKQLIRNRV